MPCHMCGGADHDNRRAAWHAAVNAATHSRDGPGLMRTPVHGQRVISAMHGAVDRRSEGRLDQDCPTVPIGRVGAGLTDRRPQR